MNWEDIKKRKFIILIHCLIAFLVLIGEHFNDSFELILYTVGALASYYLVWHLICLNYVPAIDITMLLIMGVIWFISLEITQTWYPLVMFLITAPFFVYLSVINLIVFWVKYISSRFTKSGKAG